MTYTSEQRQWRKENPDKQRNYRVKWQQNHPAEYARITKEGYEKLIGTKEGMARRMVYKARERKRGIVSVTAEDILAVWPEDDRCPVFGAPFEYGRRVNREASPNTPSLDRVDSKRGYVVGNVAVISWRANAIKRDADVSELEAVARWLKGVIDRAPSL